MSRNNYANLKSYNEDYGYCPGKMIRLAQESTPQEVIITENFHSLPNNFYLLESELEGFYFEPAVPTEMSGYLSLVLQPTGFYFNLKIRKAKGLLSVQMVFNTNDILMTLYSTPKIENETYQSGTLSLGHVSMSSEEFPYSMDSFLEMVESGKIAIIAHTVDNKGGEIGGLMSNVFMEELSP